MFPNNLENEVNEKEIQMVERLVGALGENASATVDAYVVWHVASAVRWLAVGVALLFAARWLWTYKLEEEWEIKPNICGAVAAVVLGVGIIVSNVPDLFAPRAIAIHQLLKDIVPG